MKMKCAHQYLLITRISSLYFGEDTQETTCCDAVLGKRRRPGSLGTACRFVGSEETCNKLGKYVLQCPRCKEIVETELDKKTIDEKNYSEVCNNQSCRGFNNEETEVKEITLTDSFW